MLRPIDRERREGILYPGSTKTLRDFIDTKHLLLLVDANFDFQGFVDFMKGEYNLEIGRPAIHPEIVVRALLPSAIYDVPSYRQLCERISENLAWRWFCHLSLQDEVFDHSSITVFIDRIGSDGFQELLAKLNAELLRLGLLSPKTYGDSSVVKASARTNRLDSTSLTPKEFADRATEQDGVFTVCHKEPAVPEENRPARLEFLSYQDRKGSLPLSPTDPDARWTTRHHSAVLGYKENVIVDKSGFILARELTPANASDCEGIEPLFGRLPLSPISFCGDTGFNNGRFRFKLRLRRIKTYIPLHPNQEAEDAPLVSGAFAYHGDHLICREGRILKKIGFPNKDDIVFYVGSAADCGTCPSRETCLTKKKIKGVGLSRYQYETIRAKKVNKTLRYQRKTIGVRQPSKAYLPI